MELNREKIIKALEHCGSDEGTCDGCPYCVKKKDGALLPCRITADALALIRELTEENGRFIAKGLEWRGCADTLFEEIKKAKADTVRKMQEETRQRCIIIGDEEYVTICDIDQIAREMLEEK